MLAVSLLVIACLANLILAVFVISNSPKALLNRILAAFMVVLASWNIVTFLEDTGLPLGSVKLLVVLDFALAGFIFGLFFGFCYVIGKAKVRWLAWTVAALVGLNTLAAVTGQMVKVEIVDGNVHFVERFAYPLLIVLALVAMVGGLTLLARRQRVARGRERQQITFIYLGLILSATAVMVTNVVLPAIMYTSPTITRLGIYSSLFLTGFTSYTILRHRFLDIRLVVARSVAYILLLGSLAIIYGVAIFGVSQLFFDGSQLAGVERITYIALAVLLAFTFQPLRRFFERFTDRVFYRDHYDSQNVLNELGSVIVSEIELDKVLENTLSSLCRNMRVLSGQILVYGQDERLVKIEHIGPMPQRIVTQSVLGQLPDQLITIIDELPGKRVKAELIGRGCRVVVQLRTKGRLVGHLVLGEKLSGAMYTAQDIDLLEIFSQELAVAVVNALAYQEIAQFNVTLQQKVESATHRLKVANDNLQALDKTKDEFLSMASHQLRTPLTSVKGFLSMLEDGDAGPVSPQQHELLSYATDSSQRMIGMISDLLDVSRMSAGRFVIEKAPTDLAEVVQQEVHQLGLSARNKRVELKLDLPNRPLPPVMVDEGKTRQVIMNYIDNAIYYTPEKGTITVKLRRIPGNKVRYEVIDNGIGVPLAAQKQLFQKFYRADNAKVRRPDGTGLGLFLAKRVIEAQGGTILFKSEEGKGSLFGFELPIQTATHEKHL